MIGIDPTWLQTIRQQMQQYQRQTDDQLDAATYHQALNYPRSYGFGRMANALTQQAGPPNNTSTALLSPTNPFNFQLMNYMMQAPGGQTIGLPGDSGVDSSNALLAQLLGRSGVG